MTIVVAACAVVMFAQPPQGTDRATARDATVVAECAGLTVTAGELRDAAREARRSGNPKQMLDSMTASGLETLARGILERKLLAREARAAGLDRQPDVGRALRRSADTILARALLDREAASLDTGDAALRRYYDAHQPEFRTAPRRRAHSIWVKTETEAAAALDDLKAGKAFEDVAKARNIEAARADGGDLGWVPQGVMLAPFESALFALSRPGEVSGIVRTSLGFHIVRLDEIDPGSLAPFDDAREQITQAIVSGAVTRLTSDVTRRHPATIHKEMIGALLAGGK
jgi:peptidyl-prolyl cis-trans isomerase C